MQIYTKVEVVEFRGVLFSEETNKATFQKSESPGKVKE